MKRITIQGQPGCFHETAARCSFPGEQVEILPCDSFDQQFARMAADPTLLGIAAIENTIAGSLLPNHELLRRSSLAVIGEYKLRISHVLGGTAGGGALRHRRGTLAPDRPDAVRRLPESPSGDESRRTRRHGGSAREIAEQRLRGTAAICGAGAAELYGLEILERGIETNKHNFTRFLLLADRSRAAGFTDPARTNKASLVFSLPHTQGSLSKVLSLLSFYEINLSKIQSLPIIGREWEYRFYVDVTFDDPVRYRQAIEAARPLTSDFRILGEYAECPNPAI